MVQDRVKLNYINLIEAIPMCPGTIKIW